MVTKSKESSKRPLPSTRGRVLRSASEVRRFRLALRSGGTPNMEATQKGSKSESIHDRDRDSSVDDHTNESENLSHSFEAGEPVGDDLPDTP